jgi:hypothetical protein
MTWGIPSCTGGSAYGAATNQTTCIATPLAGLWPQLPTAVADRYSLTARGSLRKSPKSLTAKLLKSKS